MVHQAFSFRPLFGSLRPREVAQIQRIRWHGDNRSILLRDGYRFPGTLRA